MYLHIGNGQTVNRDKIIGIFDLDTASVSIVTREFLKRKEKEKRVSYPDSDLPRSFLVTAEGETTEVKLSRISTAGLKTRMNTPYEGAEE